MSSSAGWDNLARTSVTGKIQENHSSYRVGTLVAVLVSSSVFVPPERMLEVLVGPGIQTREVAAGFLRPLLVQIWWNTTVCVTGSWSWSRAAELPRKSISTEVTVSQRRTQADSGAPFGPQVNPTAWRCHHRATLWAHISSGSVNQSEFVAKTLLDFHQLLLMTSAKPQKLRGLLGF